MPQPIEQVVTPGLETPIGLFLVLVIGLVFAFMAFKNADEIDLLFFRLSGGSARVGNFSRVIVPAVIVLVTVAIVIQLSR